MKFVRFLPLVLVPMVIMACAKPTPDAEIFFDWKADFPSYRTWFWADAKPALVDTMLGDDILDQTIRRAVTSELDKKGLRVVVDNPDILVKYHTRFQEAVSSKPGETGYSYNWRWSRRPEGGMQRESYRKGTLSIDLIDPLSGDLVWRGSLSGAVGGEMDATSKVPGAVREILSNYPPRR